MADSTFSLEKLDPAKVQAEVSKELIVPQEEMDPLKEQAEKNADIIMELEPGDNDKTKNVLAMIGSFGNTAMTGVAQTSSKFLKTSVGELSKAGDEGGTVSKGLVDLAGEIRGLDPSKVNFMRKGIFAKIFNPVTKYFGKYEKSESVINTIITSLDEGKKTLISDNGELSKDQLRLRDSTKQLMKDFQVGDHMDKAIQRKLDEAKLSGGDNEKTKFIEEEILFPLRQKLQDIQTLQAVSQQGIVAMEIIQRNNRELIRGVDRAKNVTVNALRIAITVASALYNQKVTLEKIKAVNVTTENLIAQTSKMLKEQGTEIQKQAISSTISVDVLKQAFNDVLQSLDEINKFKADALPKMRETINQFKDLTDKGEEEIQKLEKGSAMATKQLPPSAS
jgi:uncharacterized protein YaaN involved in tellurite resistance